MAINKNFVVKNGIQVADSLIYGDTITGSVGIGTTLPLSTLDVRGRVNTTSIGSTTLFVSGISTLGTTNVSTLTAQTGNIVTGIVTTISGTTATYTNLNGTNVYGVTGVVTTISGTTANYANVSVGSSLTINGTLYMNGSPVGMGTTGILNVAGLTVSGVSTFNQISAGGTTGTSGQVLQSTGTGVTWTTFSVSYATVAGVATYAVTAGIATYAVTAGVATYSPNSGIATYASTAGIATYATGTGIATNVSGGIGSLTNLVVSGVSTFGAISAGNTTGVSKQILISTGTGVSWTSPNNVGSMSLNTYFLATM